MADYIHQIGRFNSALRPKGKENCFVPSKTEQAAEEDHYRTEALFGKQTRERPYTYRIQ